MADHQRTEDSDLPAGVADVVKAIERDPDYWAVATPETQAKFIEQLFSLSIDNEDLKHKERIPPEAPSRQWWIECPQLSEPSDGGYLCEVCRHIDFKYLIDSPLDQFLEAIPLASLKWLLEQDRCVFCRLVSSTIRSSLGRDTVPTQVDGHDIKCTMWILPMEHGIDGSRQLSVHLSEDIAGLNHARDLRFSRLSHAQASQSLVNGQLNLSPWMDTRLVKSWYDNCISGKCGPTPPPVQKSCLPGGFRMIDVQRYCIVDAPPACQYAVLSYVWGNAGGLRNLQKIKKSLEIEGSMHDKISDLPTTIKDAISLTNEVGLHYLWVDSLCIVQDDPDDKKYQIALMDRVYSSASLTIAATDGNSATAGLSGMISRPRAFPQHVAHVQGIHLSNLPLSFFNAVDHSVWNTRAWTLQERIMSFRTLFVAEQRCFFTCPCRPDVFVESSDPMENGTTRKKDQATNNLAQVGTLLPSTRTVNIQTYRRIVETYTSRHLSYPSDVLNAFKGIESVLRPFFRSDFIFGLPRSEVDSQLLWQPTGSLRRRRDPKTAHALFPSWSWAGWVGEVECNTHEQLSRIEWIEGNGERFSGKDFRYPTGANQDPARRLEYRVEWRAALEFTGAPYYYEKENPDQWFSHPTAPEEKRTLGPNLKSMTDHLLFEAETTANHNISLDHYWPMSGISSQNCTDENHTACPLGLFDFDGYQAGYVKVPGEVFLRFRDDIANGTFIPNEYEFVLISRGKISEQKDRGEEDPELLVDSDAINMAKSHFPDRPSDTSRDGCGFNRQRYDATKPWCVYNIMLVEWIDGVAYRLGVGQMHIDSWAQAHPVKKTIELG